MGKLPGINHQKAVRAFQRAGFEVARQSGHIIMTDGSKTIVLPRQNPIDAVTMFEIVKSSGLTVEQFKELM
jgi:predicted RNA binding protein YcfA (HicA-like mRNA interferase family)